MGEDGFPWKGLGARRKGRSHPGCMGWGEGRRRKGAATAWGQSRAGNEDGDGDRVGNRDKEPSLVEPGGLELMALPLQNRNSPLQKGLMTPNFVEQLKNVINSNY